MPTPSKRALDWLRQRLSWPWAIFAVALAVRLIYITAARSYRFHALDDHFEFGWEAGRIGRSLALGRGFADPFIPAGTGPTAWLPPLYPLIIGAVFRLCGVYSPLSAWVLLALNSLFGAATVPAILEIAQRCFGAARDSRRARRIALWSAWIWALYPATMQYSVRWIWETSLTTLLVAWALAVTLRLRGIGEEQSPPRDAGRTRHRRLWAWFGLLWGLIGLSNATPLLLMPVCAAWIQWRGRGTGLRAAGISGVPDRRRTLAGVALAGVVFFACLAPWTWRNWEVFHTFIPLRGNLGAELWVHNGPEDNGFPRGIVVFSQSELRGYASMGEVAYARERGRWAKDYIRSHPGRFLQLSIERLYWFWMNLPHPLADHPFTEAVREATFGFLSLTGWLGLGLAIRQRIPGAWLFAAAYVLIPVTYYFVTVGARFRHPLEPLLVVLTVHLFDSAQLRPNPRPAT